MRVKSITSFCLRLSIVICLGFSLPKLIAQDQWVYPGAASGFNGNVRALCVYNGELYVGGDFTTIDNGAISANRIAKWDGTSWSAVGSGLNDRVRILYVHNSELYVGGYFSTAGGVSAVRIAKYDGTNWSTVGSGVGCNGVPYTMATYNGDLYVGGEFATVDGITVNRLAKWNGTAWSTVGNAGVGMNGSVYALGVYNGNLYCGGSFTSADFACCWTGLACRYIAMWDGVNFSAPGTGMTSGYVYKDMLVYNNELYVPGGFSDMNGIAANNIAKYDGTTWTAVGTGIAGGGANSEVNPLIIFGSDMYAGGYFTSVDGVAASKVAKWNGTTWTAPFTALNGTVYTMCVYNGKIYAGGSFTVSGAIAVGKIATLPIDLLYFKAWRDGDKNILEWATASETNNSYFTIERSADGIIYDGIITINGAGTSSKKIIYNALDDAPSHAITYYRLKQTDFDGKSSSSEIVFVKTENVHSNNLLIYPNPVNYSSAINFSITLAGLQSDATTLVVLYDTFGNKCLSKYIQTDSHGSINFSLDNGALQGRGVYMIQAICGNKQFSKKLLIE